jgi:DNA-directed RNA polymerase specialized sigma24 family protein
MERIALTNANNLIERWLLSDMTAAAQLSEMCQAAFAYEVDRQTATEWISELQKFGPAKLGFDVHSGQNFLEWAVNRVNSFAQDPHRKQVYAFYAGDSAALDELYRATWSDLIQSLRKFGESIPDDTRFDLVADFFRDFMEKAEAGRHVYIAGRGKFLTWAKTAVARRAISFLRKGKIFDQLPEGEADAPFVIAPNAESTGTFQEWVTTGLTSEQRTVFDLLIEGHEQQDIVCFTGFGSARVSKMLDEIRSRIADRMQTGGYEQALRSVLDRIRAAKGTKGLLTRLFLRFVVPTLLDSIRPGDEFASLSAEAFGASPRELLWTMNPENSSVVERVADQIVALYAAISRQAYEHTFCVLVRRFATEPWGHQIDAALERSAALKSVAAGVDSINAFDGRGDL